VFSSDISFLVEAIKASDGGEKLSNDALRIIGILFFEKILLPADEFDGSRVLMNAHDKIWKDQYWEPEIRLEVSRLLFDLAFELSFRRNK